MLIPHTSGDWKSKIRATAWSVLVTTLFLTVSSHGRMRRRQKAFWSLGGGGVVTKSCLTLATPWTIACQAPLSVGYSRQEYWSGLPFPSPGDLPNPGIEPRPPALQADSLPPELQGKPWSLLIRVLIPSQGLYTHNLITSQRHSFQIPSSHGGLGLQYMNLGGTKFSH